MCVCVCVCVCVCSGADCGKQRRARMSIDMMSETLRFHREGCEGFECRVTVLLGPRGASMYVCGSASSDRDATCSCWGSLWTAVLHMKSGPVMHRSLRRGWLNTTSQKAQGVSSIPSSPHTQSQTHAETRQQSQTRLCQCHCLQRQSTFSTLAGDARHSTLHSGHVHRLRTKPRHRGLRLKHLVSHLCNAI